MGVTTALGPFFIGRRAELIVCCTHEHVGPSQQSFQCVSILKYLNLIKLDVTFRCPSPPSHMICAEFATNSQQQRYKFVRSILFLHFVSFFKRHASHLSRTTHSMSFYRHSISNQDTASLIAQYLSRRDVLTCMCVCHEWEVQFTPCLWSDACLQGVGPSLHFSHTKRPNLLIPMVRQLHPSPHHQPVNPRWKNRQVRHHSNERI